MDALPRRLTLVLGAGIVLASVVGLGGNLVYTQTTAADKLRRDFVQRASLTADLTGGTLRLADEQNRQYAEQHFAGSPDQVQRALAAEPPTAYNIVLRADGTVVAANPAALRGPAGRMLAGTCSRGPWRRNASRRGT